MFCERCHRRFDATHVFCPSDGATLVDAPDLASFRARPTKQIGAILGNRYEVRGFIGKGAMARVYLAEDHETHGPVAVKVLEPMHAKDTSTRERFHREAQAVNRIGHPNIVKVLDAGQRGDGAPYLVMEFLFGESLGDWLRRDHAMPLETGLPIVAQIADALGAAHAVGIVHRDVKPDNVFLVGEPGSPYGVKLVDFGFAKVRGEVSTQTGVAIGTLEYMAPEQAVSDNPRPETDVYGLGVLMFRAFSGDLPWPDSDDADLLAHQLVVEAPRLELADADPRVARVVARTLRKRPENRYPTMEELMQDLERLGGLRDGELFADGPLVVEPDVYEPAGPFSRAAARYLYRRIGAEPPSF